MKAVIEKPREYQSIVINDVFEEWKRGLRNVMLIAPTGAGKTVIMAFTAKMLLDLYPNKTIVIFAHRDVLLSQISMTVAMVGIPHRMLCSKTTESMIGHEHLDELGHSYLDDKARLIIASVPTWIKRDTKLIEESTAAWLMDETHHVLKHNMWGEAVLSFKSALGLGVTATPKRADKRGLGRHSDGVFDSIVLTPNMGELIMMGNLSHYKVYTPRDLVDMTGINVTASGDYNQQKAAKAIDKAEITGDAVKYYKQYANGKQGIIFAASIANSDHIAETFRKAGVNAVALSSKTKQHIRQQKVKEFRQGKITLLVNYDLFGEGFDVPAVEVVIMLRKTASYALFKQMFGRCLRVFDGKDHGILIDHVGNVKLHCSEMEHVHDDPPWTLDRYTKNEKAVDNGVMTRTCPKCRFWYVPKNKHYTSFVCPDCGAVETMEEREATAAMQQDLDGVLVEYDTGWLKTIGNKIKQIMEDPEVIKDRLLNSNMPRVAAYSAASKHKLRMEAQKVLREWMVHWCNEMGNQQGLSVTVTQGEFRRVFNVGVFEAQLLSEREANELTEKIKDNLLEQFLTF